MKYLQWSNHSNNAYFIALCNLPRAFTDINSFIHHSTDKGEGYYYPHFIDGEGSKSYMVFGICRYNESKGCYLRGKLRLKVLSQEMEVLPSGKTRPWYGSG